MRLSRESVVFGARGLLVLASSRTPRFPVENRNRS